MTPGQSVGLDKILGEAQSRKRGCAVCGEPPAAQLLVQIRDSADRGKTRSQSVSLCEVHAVAAWERTTAALKDGVHV